jgi:NTE family protein
MTTAFVLSGGANLGAVQVGMIRALASEGIHPDLIVGTSVGALNGAWLASRTRGTDIGELQRLWEGLRRRDVFPTSMFGGLHYAVGRASHLAGPGGLRSIVNRSVSCRRLEETVVPLHVIATQLLSGAEVRLSSGPLVDAVCASAAIPAVFPPVSINGVDLVDGGLVNNCPISHALELGATTVYVLACGYACALGSAPKHGLAIALHAVSVMIHHRLRLDVERFAATVDLRVLPTLCPLRVAPTDFGQAKRLIDESEALALDWLRTPDAPRRRVAHAHERSSGARMWNRR